METKVEWIKPSNPLAVKGVLAYECPSRPLRNTHRMFILTEKGVGWTTEFNRFDVAQRITINPLAMSDAEYWLDQITISEIAEELRAQIERAKQPSTTKGYVFPEMPQGWGV